MWSVVWSVWVFCLTKNENEKVLLLILIFVPNLFLDTPFWDLEKEFKIPKTVLQEHAAHEKVELKLNREDEKEYSHLMKNLN